MDLLEKIALLESRISTKSFEEKRGKGLFTDYVWKKDEQGYIISTVKRAFSTIVAISGPSARREYPQIRTQYFYNLEGKLIRKEIEKAHLVKKSPSNFSCPKKRFEFKIVEYEPPGSLLGKITDNWGETR